MLSAPRIYLQSASPILTGQTDRQTDLSLGELLYGSQVKGYDAYIHVRPAVFPYT
jgi:hypothetical protein